MSTVVTVGGVVIIVAFLAMFVFSRWRLSTIAVVLVGVVLVYVGAVAWFSKALDARLKTRKGADQVDTAADKVAASGQSNGVSTVQTNAL